MKLTVARARKTFALVQAQQLPFLAAAIAYYAFLSVVPLLVVALAVATAVAGETLAAELLESLDQFLTPDAADLLESTLVDARGRSGVTVLGLALLLWGALRVFRGLDIAFSQVYNTRLQKSLAEQVRDALLVLVAVALAITATVVGSLLLSLSSVGLSGLAGSLSLLVVLPVVFFPLYYVFPAEDVTVQEAIPGAVLAGASWSLLGTVFGIYASQASSFQLYGVLGGVLLLLVWFYFAGLLLLVGAALNAILAGRLEDRQLQHGGPRRSKQRGTMAEEPPADNGGSDVDGSDATDSNGAEPRGDGTDAGSGADGRDRVPDGGEPQSDDSTQERRDDETRYPGVQSLQLTRGDIPRYRGERPNEVTEEDLEDIRERIGEFESEIEGRTVHREELEGDLRRYVRQRTRRGHARGWGPYLVLGYGTAMTLGAFFYLGGIWAILAMLVIWLSTLGLYALMVIVGMTSAAIALPGRVAGRLRGIRSLIR
jgi:membrane protein